MANPTPGPRGFRDQLSEMRRQLDDRIDRISTFDGSQYVRAVEKLQELINDLPGMVDDVLATAVNTGTVTASGSVTAGGNVNATGNVSAGGSVTAGGNITASGRVNAIGSLQSVGAFNTDVSTYPGSRQPMWQNTNGMIGYAPSTREKKTHIRTVPFTAENVRACMPRVFAYKTQVDIRDNPENEFYDPEYVVPDEAGLFAEDLIANGLEAFVIYEGDGTTPAGIDYAGFGAVANLVAVRDLYTLLEGIGDRVTTLEERY